MGEIAKVWAGQFSTEKRASFRGKEESTVRDAKQVPFLFIDFLEQMFHEAYFNLSNEKFALQSKGFTIWI